MASIQLRYGTSYRIAFRYHDKQHVLNVGKVSEREARQWLARTENLLMRGDRPAIRTEGCPDVFD